MNRLASYIVAALLLVTSGAKAQNEGDSFLFTHLGAGVSIGTDGVGIEVATPVTPYLGLRAGVSFIPKISVNVHDIEYTRNGNDGEGDVKASLKKFDGKLLVDVYPFGNKLSLHLTGGLFVGSDELIRGSFKEDLAAPIGGGIVKKIGQAEWLVEAIDHKVELRLMTKKVKPYLGIGFGRMVPKPNKRVGVSCDLGVQFHGTPDFQGFATAHTISGDLHKWVTLSGNDFDFGEDFKENVDDALDIVHKVKVWPVLNIRITGRIF